MADDDYRPLAAACGCGKPLKVFASSGRTSKKCSDTCKVTPSWKTARACSACGAVFVPRKPGHFTCGPKCRAKLKCKPLLALPCAHCGERFKQDRHDAIYCGTRCKVTAWRSRNADRVAEYVNRAQSKRASKRPQFTIYYAGFCKSCGQAFGLRANQDGCCSRACHLALERKRSRERSEAEHRAAGVVIECGECRASFCPVYGARGRNDFCAPCAAARKRRAERVAKACRKAIKRCGGHGASVDPLSICERDGWRCVMCNRPTPKELRGTYDECAPEVDHLEAVALGGNHSPDNLACMCRRCNGWKRDMPLDAAIDYIHALLAQGYTPRGHQVFVTA